MARSLLFRSPLTACLAVAGCAAATPTGSPASGGATGSAEPSAAPAHPAVTSACDLVTEADATTTLGVDPGAGTVATSTHGASSCSFGTYPSLVIVNLIPTEGNADYANVHDKAPAGTITDVSGVGDAAFSVIHSPSYGIEFYQGAAFVAIVVINNSADASSAKILTLARTLAGRL